MKIDAQNYKKTLTRFMGKGFFLFISKKIITFAGISALFNYADCKNHSNEAINQSDLTFFLRIAVLTKTHTPNLINQRYETEDDSALCRSSCSVRAQLLFELKIE